jgi:type VI secretion system Hcp family effector
MEAVMKSALVTGVFAFGVGLLAGQVASAQTANDAFLLVPGIPGESLDERHARWIEVLSLSQGFSDFPKESNVCDVAIQKRLDKSGPLLFAAAVTGQIFPHVQIDLVKPSTGQRYYEILLTNARLSSLQSSPQFLTESLTLIAESITLSYFPQRADGSPDVPVTAVANCK